MELNWNHNLFKRKKLKLNKKKRVKLQKKQNWKKRFETIKIFLNLKNSETEKTFKATFQIHVFKKNIISDFFFSSFEQTLWSQFSSLDTHLLLLLRFHSFYFERNIWKKIYFLPDVILQLLFTLIILILIFKYHNFHINVYFWSI